MEDKDKVTEEIKERTVSHREDLKEVEILEIVKTDFKDREEKKEEAIKKETRVISVEMGSRILVERKKL